MVLRSFGPCLFPLLAERQVGTFNGARSMPQGRRWLRSASPALLTLLACSQVAWVVPTFSALPSGLRSQRHDLDVVPHHSSEALETRPRPAFLCQATLLLVVLGSLAMPARAALGPSAEYPDGNPVAADLRLPPLPQDEMQRRRTAARDILKDEKWYKQGKRAFESNCAGCHPLSRFVNERNQDQLLTKEYFSKRGGIDDSRIQYNIRYGAGNMPGYAADCGDLNDNFASTCSTIVPLSEEKLRDVQDYLLNRVNTDDWQTPP
eukprot:s857_g22.t1